jgi:hypothetical protein
MHRRLLLIHNDTRIIRNIQREYVHGQSIAVAVNKLPPRGARTARHRDFGGKNNPLPGPGIGIQARPAHEGLVAAGREKQALCFKCVNIYHNFTSARTFVKRQTRPNVEKEKGDYTSHARICAALPCNLQRYLPLLYPN